MLPVLRQHDRSGFEIVAYSSVDAPDEWTRKISAHTDVWREVANLNDGELAELIRNDRVDVLVDLSMHMTDNRLRTFAERPAPVQLSWLAYPGTTGVDGIDYRLTDPFLDPPGAALPYSERSLWLPDTFWCYDPDSDEPVRELPALADGQVTFGCLNNFLKVNRVVLDLWARVLTTVPSAKLLMLAPSEWARNLARETLEKAGVARERVEFVGMQTRSDYLATYHRIDVCLDCVPYNGHTTSLDAFWMGVPVVTLVGPTVVGRAGLSQATQPRTRRARRHRRRTVRGHCRRPGRRTFRPRPPRRPPPAAPRTPSAVAPDGFAAVHPRPGSGLARSLAELLRGGRGLRRLSVACRR